MEDCDEDGDELPPSLVEISGETFTLPCKALSKIPVTILVGFLGSGNEYWIPTFQ